MDNSKKKKIIMKATAISLCSALAATTVMPVMAADVNYLKDENVYVTLKEDGEVSEVYVVNEFTSKKKSTLVDHGDYSSVKNLTTDDRIQKNGDKFTVTVPKGKFYYQGNIKSQEIPWNIQITYYLDGKEIPADQLAGKSGHLHIQIKVSENKNANHTFFDHYLLQATVVLGTDTCSNIVADGATAGNVGKNRQLLYNIMAGEEKKIEISADVKSFEMDGITFQGVPMGFDIDKNAIDTSNLTQKTSEIKDGTSKLDDGAQKLKNGSNSLMKGVTELSSGASQLQNGITSYTDGTAKFTKGVKQYINGSQKLNAGTKKLSSLQNLGQISSAVTTLSDNVNGKGDKTLAAGSKALSDGLQELKKQVDALADSTDTSQLTQLTSGLQEIKTSLQTLSTQTESLSKVVAADAQAAAALTTEHQAVLKGLKKQAAAINAQLDQASETIDDSVKQGAISQETANALKQKIKASRVDVTMPPEDAVIQKQAALLSQSAEKLSEASKAFDGAAKKLSKAAGQITVPEQSAQSTRQLQAAINSAAQGAASLQSGIGQLGQGLDTLETKTKSLPKAAAGVKELIKGSDKLNNSNKTILSAANRLNTAGVSLKNGLQSLNNGITKLGNGVSNLQKGTGTLKEGTGEFRSQTADIDQQIDDEMDRMLNKISGSNYKPVSFTSDENTDIGLVQFAIRTDDIKKPEVKEKKKAAKKESFIDKIKNLF